MECQSCFRLHFNIPTILYDVITVMAGQKSSLHFNRLAILSDVIIVKAGWNVSLYLNAVRAVLSMMLSLSNTDNARQIFSCYNVNIKFPKVRNL